jgi:hypothetical protein
VNGRELGGTSSAPGRQPLSRDDLLTIVRHDFMAAVRTGRMTMAQIIAEHFHEVWTRAARQTGVHDERESP